MDYTQPWTYSLEAPLYHPASSASVSSYFVRPNRIVKTSSRSNSPRSLKRRKTTTSASSSSRPHLVIDQLPLATQQWSASTAPRSRPVSWHPNSMDDLYTMSNALSSSSIDSQDLSTFTFSTANVNGLITPLSHPVINEPQIQELLTPLDDYCGDAMVYPAATSHLTSDGSWPSQVQSKHDHYTSINLLYQPSHVSHSWQPSQPHQMPGSMHVQTAPSSPDCLPLQVDNLSLDTTDLDGRDNSEELVGMGLYDSPADVQSSSALFGGFSEPARRGLKLEESFVPEECEEEDFEEAEEVDDVEDEENPFQVPRKADYSSQSIANHMGFPTQQEPNPIASTYLATLGQLSSTYYATTHASYGWI